MNRELLTPRLLLRPYRQADRARFVLILSDPVVNKFMGGASDVPFDNDRLFDRGLEIVAQGGEKHHEIWAVVGRQEPDLLIGHCELKQTETTVDGQLEIVYLLAPEYWRKGYGRELVSIMVDYAFTHAGCRELIATVDPGNESSIHLLSTCGFQFADRFRDEDGDMTDLYLLPAAEAASKSA